MHVTGEAATPDYHEQYDQDSYLTSLAASRTRQASILVSALAEAIGRLDAVLDFGAGRGWFLDACRAAGWRPIAGADTSPRAVAGLNARGIEAVVVPAPKNGTWHLELARLSFVPRTVTLLDVIEHFAPQWLGTMFEHLVAESGPSLEFVVIKVPVTNGTLYRLATGLAGLGFAGPLEQLYQAGTMPPHYNYFSRRSLRTFLERHGLSIIVVRDLIELDAATARGRVSSLGRLPAPIAALAGRALALLSSLGPRDSVVAVCVIRRAGAATARGSAAAAPVRPTGHESS